MHKAYLAFVIRNGTWINRGWQLPYQQEVTEGQDSLGGCTLLLGLSRTAELKRAEGSVGGNGREKTHRCCTISLDYVLGKGSRRNGFVSHYGGHCYLFLAVLDLCKESACNAGDISSVPELRGSPEEGNANPLKYSCPGKPLGQRSLVGYSPWGRKESTRLNDWHTHRGGIRGSFLEEVALEQGHQELVHCWQRKEQSTWQRALWGSGGGRGRCAPSPGNQKAAHSLSRAQNFPTGEIQREGKSQAQDQPQPLTSSLVPHPGKGMQTHPGSGREWARRWETCDQGLENNMMTLGSKWD